MPSNPINITAGTASLIPAQPGRRIRVLGYVLVASAAGTFQWQDGGSNNLSGPMALAVGQSLVAPFVPPIGAASPGWMVTAAGVNLEIIVGTGGAAAGHISWDYI